jgi:hypothetical protein
VAGVEIYVHTTIAGTGTDVDPREPVIWFPWLDGLMKLYDGGAMCFDLDGNPTGYKAEFDSGSIHGWIESLVEDYGPIGVVTVRVRDEQVWEHFQSVFTEEVPLVFGYTLEEFHAAAKRRRLDLWALFDEVAPQHASQISKNSGNLTLLGIESVLERINVPGSDPQCRALQQWVLGKMRGTDFDAMPSFMTKEQTGAKARSDAEFSVFRGVKNRWDTEGETLRFKVIMRLWELWRLEKLRGY